MAAYYVVQTYSPTKGGLRPDNPVMVNSTLHARRMAEKLARQKPMVIAFMREGNSSTGEFDDPKLIYAHGDNLPEEVGEMERV